ncbi:LOW QUALITY PROTEIN: uncharacterized protein LOC142017953 [Carettochelys insculpta]|uniref:LOW QUALITY PROTEIN: uncharacterized protein LOC142017953 n=1 Tax=Carettochelys insculpta TaxID=44489 RepID=UPI003EBF5A91
MNLAGAKKAICQIPKPSNRKQLRAFLGTAGFCRLWIPDFGVLAKPLYECVKGSDRDLFCFTKEAQHAFKALKIVRVMEAPALGLSDITKPFQLYVHERKGVALGILTQKVGSWKRPVAYFSKQIDTVARGWPVCLRAVAAAAIVLEEAGKLTLGGEVEVNTPHAVQALLEAKGGLWLTQARLTKYQASLLENAEVKLVTSPTLNPATLLPEKGTEEIEHDCLETIDTQCSSRPDLKDQPLLNADLEWFTDGSSQVINGKRRAGYAIVSLHETIEARPLPVGTSAQLEELIALTRALEMAKNLRVTIWTDSKFVRDNQPIPLDQPLHDIQPGDSVLLRTWKEEPLQKKWKGPHLVLLTTKTAAKLQGVKPWVHFTRVKVEPAEEKEWTVSRVTQEAEEDLGLKLLFKY